MVTVLDVYAVMSTLLDSILCPYTIDVVQPDGARSAPEHPVLFHDSCFVAQTSADDSGVTVVPVIVTDGAPLIGSRHKHLHAAHVCRT